MSEDLYNQIEKAYNPKDIEPKWYKSWMDKKYYLTNDKASNKSFSIVIPPPNVTGSLHIGHALNNTLQDIIIRYMRMKGHDSLWVPGTDHAGIATQIVVERELSMKGLSRDALGREKFVEKVWQWKAESGSTITNQLKRLGALPDWSKERFTLDEGLSDAVRKVFVDLYKEGLIYKDSRLVNWDPGLRTAISDLEVDQRDVQGKLWYIKYPIEGSRQYITVATTRPETMLGDTAVAVHPDDNRYKKLIGKMVNLPLTARQIPIIADEYSDPEKGTGAVKITPAHDFNDFEVGKRHYLEMIDIFDDTARLNDKVPEKYKGLDRFECRKLVLADLERMDLLEKEENISHTVPYGDRSGELVEPRLTSQWYVNAKELAKDAIKAVEAGKIRFHPQFWESTYFEWMRNIKPWCISRQIWWGHQVPVWYGPDGEEFCELTEHEAYSRAHEHYGNDVELKRDSDVLDTWFSSGLWPFSTLGWPESTDAFNKFYPTSVLITGFDIIFFWVARMIMMGLKFTGEVPFRDVYIHGLIRDEKGEKMSKTKGNVIDPLDISDEYGADSLRFSLAAMASQGRDIKLSLSVIKGYRNFINKIWNASRFLMLNMEGYESNYQYKQEDLSIFDKWILTKLNRLLEEIKKDFESFEYDKVANKIYQFIWADYCDWYIETAKPLLRSESNLVKKQTQSILVKVLTCSLQMLHPFTPFVTEEIYDRLKNFGVKLYTNQGQFTDSIVVSRFPDSSAEEIFNDDYNKVELLKEVVTAIRNLRAELGISPARPIKVILSIVDDTIKSVLLDNSEFIFNLASVESIEIVGDDKPDKCITQVISGVEIYVPVEGVIDLDKEIKRINNDLAKIEKDLKTTENKLNNSNFLERAPVDIVDKEKAKFDELSSKKSRIIEVLNRLNEIQ